MQYSVVHLAYLFSEEWEQDLFEQSLCDIGFEVFDNANAYIQTSVVEENAMSSIWDVALAYWQSWQRDAVLPTL